MHAFGFSKFYNFSTSRSTQSNLMKNNFFYYQLHYIISLICIQINHYKLLN